MTADRFNWKEMAQLFGAVAAVALIQVGLLIPDTRDFIGSWVVMTLFGVIYAVIGGVTTSRFVKTATGGLYKCLLGGLARACPTCTC